MMPFWTAPFLSETCVALLVLAEPFANISHNALHFLSARCSSRSKELLKVSLAEIPYSFMRAATESGCASPNPTRPPPHKQSLGAPYIEPISHQS